MIPQDYKDRQVKAYVPERERAKAPFMRAVVDEYLKANPLPLYSAILDIGCGTGTLLNCFLQRGYPRLEGCDINEAKLLLAKEFPFPTEYADMHSLPYKDEYFDLIVSFHTIEHAWDIDKVLGEVKRIKKPDGKFFCIVPYEPTNTTPYGKGNAHTHPFISEQQVRDEFGKYFNVISVEQKCIFEPEFFIIGQ